jgi:hypothetical protein
MSDESRGLYRLGGISFIVSGLLFLLKYILDLMTGPPPSSGTEILAWTAARGFSLAMNNEVLFFAVVFLIPAVIALYESLAGMHRAKAALGCGILAAVIPVTAVLDIVHGRLVYPVYGIHNTPAAAELIVAFFHGGLHAVGILLGIGTFVLSLAMRRGAFGGKIAILGFTTAVFDIVGAYPWAIGPIPVLVSQVLFAAWFSGVGWKLYRMASLSGWANRPVRHWVEMVDQHAVFSAPEAQLDSKNDE